MRDGKKQGVGSMLLELGKRKIACHLTLCERMVFLTLGCLWRNGAAEEYKGEDGLRSR